MKIINIKDDSDYLEEYIRLCSLEWGKSKSESEMKKYVVQKKDQILNDNKVISILGMLENDNLIGFISLFEYEDDEPKDLTPWYGTMYVKKEYRGKGYSKILNNEILKEAKKLGYDKVYLKSELINYYEKFGAIFIKDLRENEKLYYINLENINL